MVDPNSIRELLHRTPFVPFRLVASSGSTYDITNPELVVVMNREVFIAHGDLDRHSRVPLLHIAAIDTLDGSNGAGRRGPRRRRRR
jgi:hypothetical protein